MCLLPHYHRAMCCVVFALLGYIQASRALMIASIVFGTFGIVATLVGMKCSKIGGENYVLKGRIAAVGGVLFLLQGEDENIKSYCKPGGQRTSCLCSYFNKRLREN